MPTLPQLYLLSNAGAPLEEERRPQIERALAQDRHADMPWYLRFIVGFGAWLASGFFIGFFLVAVGWQEEHRRTLGIAGVVLLAVSTVLVRQKFGLFVNQCCLAASLAGQFMLYYGFLPAEHHTLGSAAVLSIGLAVLLYGLYPDILQRLITCVAALQITLAWVYLDNNGVLLDGDGHPGHSVLPLATIYWALHLAGIAWCLLRTNRQSVLLAPLGYALVFSLAAWQLEDLGGLWLRLYAGAPLWLFYIRPVSTAVALLGVITWAAGGQAAWQRFPLPFACLVIALSAMIWLGGGGILPALFLITLGFFVESRVIQVIGLILLPIFISHYYYYLRLDLMAKSVSLIGSGLALLLLRTGLGRWLPADTKESS